MQDVIHHTSEFSLRNVSHRRSQRIDEFLKWKSIVPSLGKLNLGIEPIRLVHNMHLISFILCWTDPHRTTIPVFGDEKNKKSIICFVSMWVGFAPSERLKCDRIYAFEQKALWLRIQRKNMSVKFLVQLTVTNFFPRDYQNTFINVRNVITRNFDELSIT